jgi:hypothetical protein
MLNVLTLQLSHRFEIFQNEVLVEERRGKGIIKKSINKGQVQ